MFGYFGVGVVIVFDICDGLLLLGGDGFFSRSFGERRTFVSAVN